MEITPPSANYRTATGPSGHQGPAGITVAEALQLPCLARATLRAGASGLDRRIRSVNMMEVPDISRWLREDELLVTTAYPLDGGAAALPELLRLLARNRLAGLALKTGRYLGEPSRATLELADRLALPLIELQPDASFNDILAEVLGTVLNRQAVELERSNTIHERLTAVVLAGGDLPDVIEALVEVTGCDAAISDATGGTLAASRGLDELESAGLVRVSRELQAGGAWYGTLSVFSPRRQIPRSTLVAMEHAATIAALILVHTRAVAGRARQSRIALAEEMLASRPVRPEQVRARAQALGWDLEVPRAALLVTISGDDRGGEGAPAAPDERDLVDLLTAIAGPQTIGWGRSAGLAALIIADAPQRTRRIATELRSAIEDRWPDTHAAVGTGRAYTDLADLHRSQREAARTLTLGHQLRGESFALSHDDLTVYRLLDEIPADTLERFCADALHPLVASDRGHGGALLSTLEAYFAHGRNRTATAQALGVHYNTLRNRMARIEALLDEQIDDAQELLSLELALHARRLLTARGRGLPTL